MRNRQAKLLLPAGAFAQAVRLLLPAMLTELTPQLANISKEFQFEEKGAAGREYMELVGS